MPNGHTKKSKHKQYKKKQYKQYLVLQNYNQCTREKNGECNSVSDDLQWLCQTNKACISAKQMS